MARPDERGAVPAPAGALTAAAVGVGLVLAGFFVDAALHAGDPALASREGVFAVGNPGHVLIGLGLAIAPIGLVRALTVAARGRPWLPGRSPGLIAFGLAILLIGSAGAAAGGWVASLGQGRVLVRSDPVHAAGGVQASARQETDPAAPEKGPAALGHLDEIGLPTVAAASSHERARASALLERTREATRKYEDPSVAERDGYIFDTTKPVLVLHAPNARYRNDGRILDPSRPESLVYLVYPEGRLDLVGVMFVAEGGEVGPRIGGPMTQWHVHQSCVEPATGRTLAPASDVRCLAGEILRQSDEVMHVWFTDLLVTAFSERAPMQALTGET